MAPSDQRGSSVLTHSTAQKLTLQPLQAKRPWARAAFATPTSRLSEAWVGVGKSTNTCKTPDLEHIKPGESS